MTEAASLHRIDCLIWSVIAAISAVVLAASIVGDFVIVWPTFALPAGSAAILFAGSWYYRRWRNDLRISTALGSTAQMVVFTAVGAPLSYIAASANFPLQDHVFAGIDRALGLDWKALLAWMNALVSIHFVFAAAYLSFIPQVIVAVLALGFAGRLVEVRVFMLALIGSAVICVAISAIIPAEGVWGYYGLTKGDYPAILPATRELHLPTYYGLRDGSFRYLTGMDSEGIITFPSFHAALGVIFIVAMWSVPVLRWFGLAVNAVMLVSIPIDGGHYFIDAVAGIAIAGICLRASNAIVSRIAVSSQKVEHVVASGPLSAAE